MSYQRELKALRAIAYPPVQDPDGWYARAEDGVTWLQANTDADYVVLHAQLGEAYVHSVLAPIEDLTPPKADQLITADLHADRGWIIEHEWGAGGRKISLESPLRGRDVVSIQRGEALVFRRNFDGYRQHRPVVEINQRLVQALDLHFLPERGAWCRLDARGDLEDVIIIVERAEGDNETETIVLIRAEPLAEYMAVSRQAIFFKFDFTRIDWGNFTHWGDAQPKRRNAPDLFYAVQVGPGRGSYRPRSKPCRRQTEFSRFRIPSRKTGCRA